MTDRNHRAVMTARPEDVQEGRKEGMDEKATDGRQTPTGRKGKMNYKRRTLLFVYLGYGFFGSRFNQYHGVVLPYCN